MDKNRKGIELLEQIRQSNNVRRACKELGISRSQYYKLLQSPLPKPPRTYQPDKMGKDTAALILEFALQFPLGCHHIQEQLFKEGIKLSSISIQKILNQNNLGKINDRGSALEKMCLESKSIQLSTEQTEFLARYNPALLELPRNINRPGELISIFSYFLGQMPWLGKVYLYFCLDSYSGYAHVVTTYGPDKYLSASFLKQTILPFYAEKRIPISIIETSNDADFFSYKAHPFSSFLRAHDTMKHQRTTIGSTKTNGYCQLFNQYLQNWIVPGLKKSKHLYRELESLNDAAQLYMDRYNRAEEPAMREHFNRYPFLGISPLEKL